MIKKFVKTYNDISAPVKASFWFMICAFLKKAMAMITTPILTRFLTVEEYGTHSLFQSWYNILIIIATLNLASGVHTKGLVKNEEDGDRYTSSLLGLSTITIGILFIIYVIGYKLWNDITKLSTVLMVAMFLDFIFHISFHFWANEQRVKFKYKKLVALTLLNVFSTQIVGILIVVFSPAYKIELRAIATALIGAVLLGGTYIRIMKKGKIFCHKGYWKHALLFNLPLIPHYLSQIVLNQSDRIMIADICGKEKAGIYSLAYSLGMVMQIFSSSVSQTMNPWIYKNLKEGNYKNIAKNSYYILIAVACVNFAVVALAPEFLSILAPPTYQEALWIIPPVTASVYFMFLYNLFATFEFYYDKTGYVMLASVSGALLNVILNWIFINKYGFLAAGWTTILCYILYAFAHYLFMRMTVKKHLNNQKIYNVKIIFLIGFVLMLDCVFMMFLYNKPYIRYSIIGLGLVAVFILRNKIISFYKELKQK